MGTLTGTDLEGYELLAGLPMEDLEAMAGCAERVEVRSGEALFQQGERARHFFLVEEGRVVVQMDSPGGEAANVLAVRRREPFGWSGVVEPRFYTGSAQAVDRSLVIRFDADRLLDVFDKRSQLGYRFMSRLASLVATRLKEHWVEICSRTRTWRPPK